MESFCCGNKGADGTENNGISSFVLLLTVPACATFSKFFRQEFTINVLLMQAPETAGNPTTLKLQKNRHNLPSHDALAEILPEYEFLFKAPVPSKVGPSHSGQHNPHTPPGPAQTGQQGHPDTDLLNQTYRPDSSDRRPGVPGIEDNSHAADVTAHEAREVENYRTAMRKMAEDIIALRKKVGGLESDNSQLRSELSLHQDLGRTLLDDTDIDVMTKAEIADRLASLKFKLASETAEVTTLKDKIQQLQNELIRKNDSEKELLRLQRAHQQQQAVLQKYQARVAKMNSLEATVRQQEKVIEKMEKVLDSKLKEKKRDRGNTMTKQSEGAVDDNRRKEMESALAAENTRLRGELEKLRYQTGPLVIQQPAQTQDPFPDNEKLSLLTRLEKAQARIQVLESQLEENARRWGREKQDLLTRLSEHDHGFARTSTMILHDFPLKHGSTSLPNPSRHRKLDPLT